MRFAVIGTGAIVEKFLAAARSVPEFSLAAVYSRTEERGAAFAAAQGNEQLIRLCKKNKRYHVERRRR